MKINEWLNYFLYYPDILYYMTRYLRQIRGLLILLSLVVNFGCTKPETELPSFAPTLPDFGGGGSPQTNCYIEEQDSYEVGLNPTTDFIKKDLTVNAVVSATNCSGVTVGQTATGQIKYLTRNGSTITSARNSTISGYSLILMDLSVSGTSVLPLTLNSCSNGYTISEQVVSGSLSSATNKMILNLRTDINYTGCATANPTNIYEHTALKGLWKKSCSGSEKSFVSFYRNAGIYTTTYYANAGCSTANLYIEQNGPYSIRSSATGTHQVDISFQRYFVYLYNSAMVTAFNAGAICGLTNWTQGSDIDVSGRTCDFASIGVAPSRTFPVQNSFFDLINISGTSMRLGDLVTGDGVSNATRPTTVSSDIYSKDTTAIYIPEWAGTP